MKLIRRILLISLGFTISGLGTAIMYNAGIGSTPNATFADGLHSILHISYGMGNALMNLLVFIPVLVWGRKLIGLGTWLCMLTMGLYINFWKAVLPPVSEASLMARILIACIGNVIFAAGLSFYINLKEGQGPLDAMTELIHRKLKCSYGLAKCVCDGIFLVTGILLGGVAGIATVISVLCTGYLMQCFFLFYDKKIHNRRRVETKK